MTLNQVHNHFPVKDLWPTTMTVIIAIVIVKSIVTLERQVCYSNDSAKRLIYLVFNSSMIGWIKWMARGATTWTVFITPKWIKFQVRITANHVCCPFHLHSRQDLFSLWWLLTSGNRPYQPHTITTILCCGTGGCFNLWTLSNIEAILSLATNVNGLSNILLSIFL